MKLYATTTSERATKGQGGNKFIDISLSVGSAKDSKPIARIVLASEGEYYRLTTRVGADERASEVLLDIEGRHIHDYYTREDREIKGKQQTGEIVEPWDINPADNK